MSQICGNDLQFSLTRRTRRRDMRTSFGETDRRDLALSRSPLRSHRPERRKTWRQSRTCGQIDCTKGTSSGHARDRQNPVDFDKTAGRYFSAVAPSGLTVLSQFLLDFQRAACRIVRFSILSGQAKMNEVTVLVPASFPVDGVLLIRP